MPVIAVPAFALTWWMGCYLVSRDPRRAVLQRTAGGLIAFALAVACWTIAPLTDGLPLTTAAEVLLCVPPLAVAGAAVGMLSDDVPERRQIERGWLLTSVVLLLMVPALPPAGRLVVLAPLAGALVVLWRFRDGVRPRTLPTPLTVVSVGYGFGLAAVLLPVDLGAPVLVLAAIALDLAVLAFLVAVSDAVDSGERLRPDLRRSAVGAAAVALAIGGPATLTMLAAPEAPVAWALQFSMVATAMSVAGLAGAVRRALDHLAFLDDERLRLDRVALTLVADSLPRRRERHRLIAVSEDEFLRLTRRALHDYADLGRLLRNPLIDLPSVERRLTARGRAPEQPLARAVELRAVLREKIDALKPPGVFGTTEEWRFYNALHFCSVVGLRPYRKRGSVTGLDRDARRALDWFRRYVPPSSLRQWHRAGSQLVAADLWAELITTDPGWLGRSPRPPGVPTRGADRH